MIYNLLSPFFCLNLPKYWGGIFFIVPTNISCWFRLFTQLFSTNSNYWFRIFAQLFGTNSNYWFRIFAQLFSTNSNYWFRIFAQLFSTNSNYWFRIFAQLSVNLITAQITHISLIEIILIRFFCNYYQFNLGLSPISYPQNPVKSFLSILSNLIVFICRRKNSFFMFLSAFFAFIPSV